jgi:hypothetical protein
VLELRWEVDVEGDGSGSTGDVNGSGGIGDVNGTVVALVTSMAVVALVDGWNVSWRWRRNNGIQPC